MVGGPDDEGRCAAFARSKETRVEDPTAGPPVADGGRRGSAAPASAAASAGVVVRGSGGGEKKPAASVGLGAGWEAGDHRRGIPTVSTLPTPANRSLGSRFGLVVPRLEPV
jgi:hypothetical protein